MKKMLKIIAVVLAVLVCSVLFLQLGFNARHNDKRYIPDYKKEDLTEILNKENFSDDDYKLILSQTGLYKKAVDAIFKQGKKENIFEIQKNFFDEFEITYQPFAPFTCSHIINESLKTLPLENGDIIVTNSTHFSCFKVGHIVIVVDAEKGMVLNATGYGNLSGVESIDDMTNRPSFKVLRPKISKEKRQQAVDFAMKNYTDLPYSVSVGLFGTKNPEKPSRTNCAHIVWAAYKSVGIDLDSNGGPFVLPSDIAKSDELECLQVFGAEVNL